MMKTRLILLVFIALLPLNAQAQSPRPVVIELFTTQTCSSCPPADALVHTIAQEDPGVIVLSCHVDYFDSASWTDKMARPVCNARQAAYQKNEVVSQIATPTIVVNGKYGMAGAQEKLVRSAIKMARSIDQLDGVQLSRRDDVLDFTLPSTALEKPVDVVFIAFDTSQTVNIKGGENTGHDIIYTNPVKYMFKLFTWDGKYKVDSIPLKAYPAGGYALLVQEPDTGAILKAAITN